MGVLPELTPPHPRCADLSWVQEDGIFLVANYGQSHTSILLLCQRPWLLTGGLGTSAAALGKMTGVSAATAWPWSPGGRKTKPAGKELGLPLSPGGVVNLRGRG